MRAHFSGSNDFFDRCHLVQKSNTLRRYLRVNSVLRARCQPDALTSLNVFDFFLVYAREILTRVFLECSEFREILKLYLAFGAQHFKIYVQKILIQVVIKVCNKSQEAYSAAQIKFFFRENRKNLFFFCYSIRILTSVWTVSTYGKQNSFLDISLLFP